MAMKRLLTAMILIIASTAIVFCAGCGDEAAYVSARHYRANQYVKDMYPTHKVLHTKEKYDRVDVSVMAPNENVFVVPLYCTSEYCYVRTD